MEKPQEQTVHHSWMHHWLSPEGEQVISYCKEGSEHLLRFPDLADFRISTNARSVSCWPVPGTPEATLRHLLLDQVLPRCLAQTGELVLHASAVIVRQKALLIVGASQSGKSTLAGSFHSAGYPAVSDDVVLIKQSGAQVLAIPSYAGLRLWQDSLHVLFAYDAKTRSMAHYSDKKRVVIADQDETWFTRGISVLALIVLPGPQQVAVQEIGLSRLPLRDAFMELQKQSFGLELGNAQAMERHMQSLGRIVRRLRALRLSMPRDYGSLPMVRQSILEHVM